MAYKKPNWFGILLILGGGGALVYFFIMLGESNIGWAIP